MAEHMRLSAQLALSYAGKGIPLEDLIQEGNVGLIMALDTLELREDGISEAEYIREGIRGAMENLLEEEAGLQKSDGQILERINYIGEAIRNLSEELERKVTLEELSAYLDMPEAEIADVLRLTRRGHQDRTGSHGRAGGAGEGERWTGNRRLRVCGGFQDF